ncbi:DUF2269 family protein [Kiritimatiellaeota bacterium B1221]|nr:DUF2269 family protein [Kiritimatiellaeota bacterium B1221]
MQHHLYICLVWIHILCAMLWVGGMLFMTLMLIPALRGLKDPQLMRSLMQSVGKLYHRWGWGSLIVLFITGFMLLDYRGISHTQLASSEFWQSPFGTTLAWKLSFFVLVAVFSVIHDVSAIKSSKRENPTPEHRSKDRKLASWLGRVTLLCSLAIVVLGIMLVRGNPWL